MTPGGSTRMERSDIGAGAIGASGGEERKKTGETIHSGQFMVSDFETEGQEDEDDEDLGMQVVVEDVKPAIVDTVISNIISKRNPALSTDMIAGSSSAIVPMPSTSAGLELVKSAHKRRSLQLSGRYPSSQVEIDTDLSTVFNTLKITYTQKLTSPKWNPFKGIRLRWKEKIRMNNVIWRCWHMQFIMKRRTLVCQFASPLDVDVHNEPQAILLEGKYWKRKCNVIKAEYKKWRRYYVNKTLDANNIVDTTSELDFLEWSCHSNENLFMIPENIATDAFMTAISQYPFPDSREIARGAGRADFIQPSLGPLQPNFEDLMDLDYDFCSIPRLAPVPEEASDDIMKDFNYSGGYSQMNSGMQQVNDPTNSTNQQIPSQLISTRPISSNSSVITDPGTSLVINQQQQQQQQLLLPQSSIAPSTGEYSAKFFAQCLSNTASASSSGPVTVAQQQPQQLSNVLSPYLTTAQPGQQSAHVAVNVPIASDTSENTASNDEVNKDSKPRFPRSFPRGREPHNYDKCPPTTHQTLAYLVSQPASNQNIITSPFQPSAYPIPPSGIIQMSGTPPNQSLSNYSSQPQTSGAPRNPINLSSTAATAGSNSNMLMQGMNSKFLTHSQSLPVPNQATNQKPQPRSISMPTAQNFPPMLSSSQNSQQGILLQQHQQDPFKGSLHAQPSSSKSYHKYQPTPYVIPTTSPITSFGSTSRRHPSPPQGLQSSLEQSQQQLQNLQMQHHQQQQQQHHQQPQQSSSQLTPRRPPQNPDKAMIRSNSLPINPSLALPPTGSESFVVPLYQAKSSPKSRTRSNSMVMKPPGSSSSLTVPPSGAGLTAASSEPVLNQGNSALLAQLLNNNSTSTLFNVKQETSTYNAISNLQMPQQQSHHQFAQHRLQQQHQQQQSLRGSPISPASSQLQLIQSQPSPQQTTRSTTPSSLQPLFSPSASSSGISRPIRSPDSVLDSDTPMSPVGNTSVLGETSTGSGGIGNNFHRQEQRQLGSAKRSVHIHAEQKRRCNIKNGFDALHMLIPQLQQNPNAKQLSKAAMLNQGADYIKQMRAERAAQAASIEDLRREIATLNNAVTNLQTALPASGAPVSHQRTSRIMEMYKQYIHQQANKKWKFWIFGTLLESLMLSFCQTVSAASLDEMCRSCAMWVDTQCSLTELRPAVTNKLCELSTKTDLLSNPPSTLQEEAVKAISMYLTLSNSSSGPTAQGDGGHDANDSEDSD